LWEKHWSEQIAKQAVWLSGLVPYEGAAEIMQRVGQIAISKSSIWRRVERWGTAMQAVEARQQVKAYELEEPRPQDPNHSGEKMGVSMDGAMIQLVGEGWKELKVGCVFEIGVRTGQDPQTKEAVQLGSAIHNTYVAHLGGPEPFGRQIWAEARQRDWMKAEDSLAIGDGATWIWNLVSEHFYASHQLVDWFHASEHLAEAARVLYGEGTAQQRTWYRRWTQQLYLGHARKLVSALKSQATRQPNKSESLLQQAGYFQNRIISRCAWKATRSAAAWSKVLLNNTNSVSVAPACAGAARVPNASSRYAPLSSASASTKPGAWLTTHPQPMMNPVKGEFCFTAGKKENKQHKPGPSANIPFDVGDDGYAIIDLVLLVSHSRGLDQVDDFIRWGQSTFLAAMMNSI